MPSKWTDQCYERIEKLSIKFHIKKMEYNINGLTIAIIVVIFFAILFLVFYESWIRPKIIEYTGKHIDSNTDKDGTLTENKEKLG